MCVPGSGKLIDNAMKLTAVDNPSPRGVLPKTRPAIGELVDLISGIGVGSAGRRKKDIHGRCAYKDGGEFHTSLSVVEVTESLAGRVYDGRSDMLTRVKGFIEAHVGPSRRHRVCGQNSAAPMVTAR
jgi:hypothetical protein